MQDQKGTEPNPRLDSKQDKPSKKVKPKPTEREDLKMQEIEAVRRVSAVLLRQLQQDENLGSARNKKKDSLDLENLPKDPAIEANVSSRNMARDTETEDEAIKAETLRRAKVLQLFQKQTGTPQNQ